MAHGLTNTDQMLYVGALPWHKLGIELPRLATAQEVEETLKLYSVDKTPIYFKNSKGEFVAVPDKYATIRQDNEAPLGVVGSQYTVLQNVQALEVLDNVTMDPNGPKYETAGTLWGGSQFWALARMPEWSEIIPGDAIGQYLLISNSHDGSRSINIQLTPIRVVCNNTLTMAVRNQQRYIKLRHTSGVLQRIEDIQDTLGFVVQQFKDTTDVYRALANTNPTSEEVEAVLQRLYPDADTKTQRNKLQRERVIERATGGFGSDVTGHKLTGWTLYNGITELVDHFNNKGAKTDDDGLSMRLDSMWYGAGAKKKDEALVAVREVLRV